MVQTQESQNRRNSTGVHIHTTTGIMLIYRELHQVDDAVTNLDTVDDGR